MRKSPRLRPGALSRWEEPPPGAANCVALQSRAMNRPRDSDAIVRRICEGSVIAVALVTSSGLPYP